MDYEYYCSLRDKMKSVPDEFELFKCETCNGKHLKAICPRLHFIPYIETVIHKYLHKEKTSRNEKMIYTKRNKRKYSTFKLYKRTNHAQRHNTFIQPKRRLRDYTGFPESAEQESANILKMAKNEANINN
jgi:AMMECR1 domain-containing protein